MPSQNLGSTAIAARKGARVGRRASRKYELPSASEIKAGPGAARRARAGARHLQIANLLLT